MHQLRQLLATMALALTAACATTGATFGSGVGDAYLEHPPYYAGVPMEGVRRDSSPIAHLPIAYQRGATQPAGFDPSNSSGGPVNTLLAEMNRYLDSLRLSTPAVITAGSNVVPPDVRFGCIPENGIPGNECQARGDSALGRAQQMQLTVGRPSQNWVAAASDAMAKNGTQRVLVITLEVGEYLLRQEGLAGTKVLELGTGNKARLAWLTSLETPVTVLQLTGALVDRNGKAIRIGAEGFHARRTRLAVSAIGGQEVLSDDDVQAARSARRSDLPGEPLAWQVALRELVGKLAAR
jgi:hypothetical protein